LIVVILVLEDMNMSDWNKAVIEEFRANEGKVGGPFKDMTLLLLHTTGAKSGEPRLNPVAYLADGERYVIIASKGGAPTHPSWYHNIVAHPEVTIEVGAEKFRVQAEVVQEPERTQLFNKVSSKYTGFAEYEKKTSRVIPVIALTRIS
jgi:deazaflavin-dependent oxidoreductase (nitroreductase family)